jgi:hypothetical protein
VWTAYQGHQFLLLLQPLAFSSAWLQGVCATTSTVYSCTVTWPARLPAYLPADNPLG